MKRKLSGVFKHTVLAAAVGSVLAVSSVAYAQTNNAGSIFGNAKPNTQITYKNLKTGVQRTITVGEDGRFNVSSVPTGAYEVINADGQSTYVRVYIGTGSSVDFEDTTEVIAVTGGRVSVIDVSSSESTAIFDAEEIKNLPLPRSSVNVALLTPGAVQGGANFGRNLPSFGGSSVAENGYYIDGMDVTNMRSLLSFANLPYEAIAQTQVKSGGYGVQYGRSLGGIINVVTKSGSNDWEFGGSAYWAPASLEASDKNTFNYNQNEIAGYNADDEVDSLVYNVFAGGPIIEDKLFFFANLQGRDRESHNYSRTTSSITKRDTPNYLVKLDWYITEDHLLRLTHIGNKNEFDVVNYANAEGQEDWTPRHGDETSRYTIENGGDISILTYTGYLTDDLTVNLMYGQLENLYTKIPNLPGDTCPYAWDTSGGVGWGGRTQIGCWNRAQSTITDQVDDKDERTSYKIDVEYNLGDHTLRAGYNVEEYDSTSPGRKYSGDIYYRYQTADENENGCRLNRTDLPCGTEAVRIRKFFTQTATFAVENTSWYLEDVWQVNDNIVVNLGLRGETFTNKAGDGSIFLESDNLVAPRGGIAWDIDGDGTKKFFATIGRYYIPVPSNTNIRSTRTELFTQDYHYVSGGWNPADGSPIGLGEKFGPSTFDEQIPNPAVIADQNLEPMHQDEIIVGYEQEVAENWVLGAKLLARTVRDGMDDMCAHDGFTRWAQDNGYDNFDPHSMAGCMIVNPGNDITIAMDLNDDGNLTVQTVPNSYHGLPEYKRNYVGLQLTADKQFSDDWQFNFSYVLSKTSGNAEGYVNSSLGQEDAGITQDFDHKNFMDGADGHLPTDRRHQIKMNGLYAITEELSVSANFSAESGMPLNCLGFVSTAGMLVGDGSTAYDFGNFDRYGASSFYCVDDEGKEILTNRGSEGRADWLYRFDMGFNYSPEAVEGLTLRLYVNNVFNLQDADTFNQVKALNKVDSDDPNSRADINPGFLKPTGYQGGRYLRLSAEYKF